MRGSEIGENGKEESGKGLFWGMLKCADEYAGGSGMVLLENVIGASWEENGEGGGEGEDEESEEQGGAEEGGGERLASKVYLLWEL